MKSLVGMRLNKAKLCPTLIIIMHSIALHQLSAILCYTLLPALLHKVKFMVLVYPC